MNGAVVVRDGRTLSVENASFRRAYLFMTCGALATLACRALALKESRWDLLALVSFLAAALVVALVALLTRPT